MNYCFPLCEIVVRQKIAMFDHLNDQKGAPGVLFTLISLIKVEVEINVEGVQKLHYH